MAFPRRLAPIWCALSACVAASPCSTGPGHLSVWLGKAVAECDSLIEDSSESSAAIKEARSVILYAPASVTPPGERAIHAVGIPFHLVVIIVQQRMLTLTLPVYRFGLGSWPPCTGAAPCSPSPFLPRSESCAAPKATAYLGVATGRRERRTLGRESGRSGAAPLGSCACSSHPSRRAWGSWCLAPPSLWWASTLGH